MSEIKEYIKTVSNEIGFAECRFASAQSSMDSELVHYQNWLANGFHCDMKYLEKYLDIRQNVRLLLEDAQSVIVLAHLYRTNFDYDNSQSNSGKISRYAWGDDYHIVLKEKCKNLIEKISSKFGGDFRVCIDTAPILERAWASRSGIGWQGKNGNVIHPRFGSYFFIAIILTTLKIPEDSPIQEQCGDCQNCINACPTNAIVRPKVIDARKCLAYWTVEAKSIYEKPKHIADNMNGRLFGCDICQEVCPWNINSSCTTNDHRFNPRFNQTALDLDYILNLEQEKFSKRFKNSPIKRIKLQGLKDNAQDIKSNTI